MSFLTIPEIWELCLEKIYDESAYVDGLTRVLDRAGINKTSKILDASCGSGFPALDLIERNYNVVVADKSGEMIQLLKSNARKRSVPIHAEQVAWSDLAAHFGKDAFDCVLCRGNSLVYADSWEQNWMDPERSRSAIQVALQNFHIVLKLGGTLYLDVTREGEVPHTKDFGVIETAKNGHVHLTWEMRRDVQNQIRTWIVSASFMQTGTEMEYVSYSYLFRKGELES